MTDEKPEYRIRVTPDQKGAGWDWRTERVDDNDLIELVADGHASTKRRARKAGERIIEWDRSRRAA